MTVYTYELNSSVATSPDVDVGVGTSPVYVLGEDVTLQFTVYESTDHSTTVDISAVTAIEWVLTDGAGSESVTKTISGSGVSITDGANGVLEVTLSSTDTSGLSAGSVRHQLTITDDGSGNQTVLAQGDFVLTETLT